MVEERRKQDKLEAQPETTKNGKSLKNQTPSLSDALFTFEKIGRFKRECGLVDWSSSQVNSPVSGLVNSSVNSPMSSPVNSFLYIYQTELESE